MENNRDSRRLLSITIEPAAEVTPGKVVNLANGSLDNHENRASSEISGLEISVEDDALVSDGESSGSSGTDSGRIPSFGSGLTRLLEGDSVHDEIKRRLFDGLRHYHEWQPEVVSIYRNSFPGPIGKAKLQAFQMFAKATQERRGRDANVAYAWYPAKGDEIRRILQDGFGHDSITNGLHGCGVYLSRDEGVIESIKKTVPDKDGIHHMLRCRVILGNLEVVPPGSKQCHPFSDKFDSGIAIVGPCKFIVWSTHINTHILPEYVVSFRHPSGFKVSWLTPESLKKPASPWMPFPALLSSLSKFLPLRDMTLITKYYRDHKDKKISRSELIKQVRKVAGDELLVTVIKSFRCKQLASGSHLQSVVQKKASERKGCRQNGQLLK